MYVKCRLELTKSTYQQVGPPLVASGQQLIPVISSYYQQLSAVGNLGLVSGGGRGVALLVEIGLTDMSKSWGAIESIAPRASPAHPANSPELICKLSPGLHINKGQSYLRERTLAQINKFSLVWTKRRPYDY